MSFGYQVYIKISQCQERLEQKKEELDGLLKRQSAIIKEFNEVVPPNNEHQEALAKVFYKKIKRMSKRSGEEEDEDYDSADDVDEDGDDDEDEEDDQEEICPPGCDQARSSISSSLVHKRCFDCRGQGGTPLVPGSLQNN